MVLLFLDNRETAFTLFTSSSVPEQKKANHGADGDWAHLGFAELNYGRTLLVSQTLVSVSIGYGFSFVQTKVNLIIAWWGLL